MIEDGDPIDPRTDFLAHVADIRRGFDELATLSQPAAAARCE
jgi:hypothetical protein